MKTAAGILLVLPTVFFVMGMVYGRLDQGAGPFFVTLYLLSAVGCLALAWPLRRTNRKLAWGCVAVGSLYVVLLILLPLVTTLLQPARTKRSTGAERVALGDAGTAFCLYIGRAWPGTPELGC